MKTKQWIITPGIATQKPDTMPCCEIPITRSGETSSFNNAIYGSNRLYFEAIKLYIRIFKTTTNGNNLYFHPFDHRLLFNYCYTLSAQPK